MAQQKLDWTVDETNEALWEQLEGNQAVNAGWTDMRFPAERTKKITGKEPKETEWRGGQVLEFENDKTQAVAFNGQHDHGYKLGSDMDGHIHIVLPSTGTGNIKFDLTYSWGEIGSVMPVETTLSKTFDITGLAANTHLLWEIGDIPSSNMAVGTSRVSSMVICSLSRDHTVGGNSSSHVYLLEVDFHYQKDQERGSRSEYVK